MATVITDLTNTTSLNNSDLLLTRQTGVDKNVTVETLWKGQDLANVKGTQNGNAIPDMNAYIDDQSIETYATARAKLADGSYGVGDTFIVTDSNGGHYEVVSIGTSTDDGGKTLTGGSLAAIRTGINIDASWYDKTSSGLQSAINSIDSAGGGVLNINTLFTLESTITLCDNLNIVIGPLGIIRRGASLGDNNLIDAIGKSGISITGSGLIDGMNSTYPPVLSSDLLENNIYIFGCSNILISGISSVRASNVSIRFNGDASNINENITIKNTMLSECARGGIIGRRWLANAKFMYNTLYNTVDSSLGGSPVEKAISLNGCIGGLIKGNRVTQDNGDAGTIICEYNQRQSEDIEISENWSYGSGDNGIKVGPAVGVIVAKNHIHNPGTTAIYIEGCYDFKISQNFCYDSGDNMVVLAEDSDTARVCINGEVTDNNFSRANKNNSAIGSNVSSPWVTATAVEEGEQVTNASKIYRAAAAGTTGATPPTHSSGSASDGTVTWAYVSATNSPAQQSYHVYVRGGSTDIKINRNTLIEDSTTAANGIRISSADYEVSWNDIKGLRKGNIALSNSGSTAGTYKVVRNYGLETESCGLATVPSGSNTVTVDPGTILHGAGSCITATPRTILNGTVAYHYITNGANNQFVIRLRNSSHGSPTVSADIEYDWKWICDNPNGTYGRT